MYSIHTYVPNHGIHTCDIITQQKALLIQTDMKLCVNINTDPSTLQKNNYSDLYAL